MKRIFIDGAAGTTGLRIRERLEKRDDLELIVLPEERRKDPEAIAEALNAADASFLCLPDAAAVEAADMVTAPEAIILDTSTAHRTSPGWTYGFPELSRGHLEDIRRSKRIAVPGCHASGFIALVFPLLAAGLLDPAAALTCVSLTGYSGGGRKMITEYEGDGRDRLLDAPRQYGIGQQHKHLKEMCAVTGIGTTPAFLPIVADFYSGMEVTVPVFAADLKGSVQDVKNVYAACYRGPVVRWRDGGDESGFLSAAALSGLDRMDISVFGNDERILLTARYDNLGKGASGAAIQCLNLALGADPLAGLELD